MDRRGTLLIDHFYCLRSAPSCAQSNHGWKSRAFDQAAALALSIEMSLGFVWEHAVQNSLYTDAKG